MILCTSYSSKNQHLVFRPLLTNVHHLNLMKNFVTELFCASWMGVGVLCATKLECEAVEFHCQQLMNCCFYCKGLNCVDPHSTWELLVMLPHSYIADTPTGSIAYSILSRLLAWSSNNTRLFISLSAVNFILNSTLYSVFESPFQPSHRWIFLHTSLQ